MNESKLISNPIQALNQEFDEILQIVPINTDEIIMNIKISDLGPPA